jgi:hypothetical protein
MDRRPVRIGTTAMSGLLARPGKQDLLERRIAALRRNPIRHPRCRYPPQRQAHRRGRNADPDTDLARRYARLM